MDEFCFIRAMNTFCHGIIIRVTHRTWRSCYIKPLSNTVIHAAHVWNTMITMMTKPACIPIKNSPVDTLFQRLQR